jgi:DNA-3-methyladenine glycosylase I
MLNITTSTHRIKNHMCTKVRCEWATNGSQADIEYHDKEWGVPVHSDKKLFELVLLETAQAGLSWSIILKKREGYRRAFDGFDADRVANYDERRIEQLMADPSVIRNRLKIQSAISNAKAFIKLQQEYGSFDSYLWSFVDGKPRHNHWKSLIEVPSRTEISDVLSKALKKKGFVFVGSTICYSLMQAVGMVNDHIVQCFRYKDLISMKRDSSLRSIPI